MGILDLKHWIVILVVVVLVFGTKKLKNLGTDVGESIKGFRKAMTDDEKEGECLQRQRSRTTLLLARSIARSECRRSILQSSQS